MYPRRFNWIWVVLAVGAALGVVLLAESIATYRYVAGHLVPDHLVGEAGDYASLIENHARQENVASYAALDELLEDVRAAHSGHIAWVRVADQQGEILASAGAKDAERIPQTVVETILDLRSQSVAETRSTPAGEVFVVRLPFRFRLTDERPGLVGEGVAPGRPRFKLAEIALFSHGAADPFWPLRRDLAVTIVAALALLASMGVFAWRLPAYLRSREINQQLALARRVQQELLPRKCPSCAGLDFAAECIPAWEVGGDYYDVFPTRSGQICMLLGDVAGKGLPAALLMGLLHGAVRAASANWNVENHAELASQLNEILCARTSSDRFVSLFWACYEPRSRELHYVNAGHLPPMVVRRQRESGSEILRLETGGPVLGLLPDAPYAQGSLTLQPSDLLVLFSDGLVEAMAPDDTEFGDERLVERIRTASHDSLDQLRQKILNEVQKFVAGRPLGDDLTLLLVRFGPAPGPDLGRNQFLGHEVLTV